MVLKSWVLEISKTSTSAFAFDTPMKSELLNETWKLLGCKEYICQGCKIICVNGADYWQHRKLAHADLITLYIYISQNIRLRNPLLISTGFLKFPFRHSFQTGIKMIFFFSSNWNFFAVLMDISKNQWRSTGGKSDQDNFTNFFM